MIIQTQKALELKYGIEKTLSSGIETAGDKTLIPSLFELNIPVPMELQQKDSGLSLSHSFSNSSLLYF